MADTPAATPTTVAEVDDSSNTSQWAIAVGIVVITVVLVMIVRAFAQGSSSSTSSSSTTPGKKVKRTNVLFTGLVNSGKTKLFWHMVHDKTVQTQTSMVANTGTLTNKTEAGGPSSYPIVDYPGHRRLRQGLWPQVAAAKVVVLVVDSVTIQDASDEGGAAVAQLIRDILRSPSSQGCPRMIVACTKSDQLTQYSAKNIKKILSSQLGKLFDSQAGSVSAVGATGVAETEADAANPNIAVSNDNQFVFEESAIDFQFLDVAAPEKEGDEIPEKYNANTKLAEAIFAPL